MKTSGKSDIQLIEEANCIVEGIFDKKKTKGEYNITIGGSKNDVSRFEKKLRLFIKSWNEGIFQARIKP